MTRPGVILILLLLLVLPALSFADSGNNAPLTLLQQPQKNSGTAHNPAVSKQDEELHDIYGPVPLKQQPPYLLLAGAVCLLLLISALLYWFFKKKGLRPAPPIPPWEKALMDLAEARTLLNPERGLLYMDRVSQILRSYIESRFAIQSTRQTTREFLQSLTAAGDSSPLRTYKTELQDCLEQADMAKFAHHLPQMDNLEKMEVAVTTFVQTTEPAEPAETAKPAKPSKQPKLTKRALSILRGRS